MESDIQLLLLKELNINGNEMKHSAVSEILKLDENQYSVTEKKTSGDSDGADTKTCDADKEIKDCDVGEVHHLDEDQYSDNDYLSEEDCSDESHIDYGRVAVYGNIEEGELWEDSDEYWDPSVRDINWDNTHIKENVEYKKWTPVEGQFDDSPDDTTFDKATSSPVVKYSSEMKDSAVSKILKIGENQYLVTDKNTSGDSDGADTKTCDGDKEIKDCDVGEVLHLDEDQYLLTDKNTSGDGVGADTKTCGRVAVPEEEELWYYSDEDWDPTVEDIKKDNTPVNENVEYKKWTPVEGQFDNSPDDIS